MASRHATVGALTELMRNEPRHRVHVEGLEAHYSFPGTMSKSQRRFVVNHVEEVRASSPTLCLACCNEAKALAEEHF